MQPSHATVGVGHARHADAATAARAAARQARDQLPASSVPGWLLTFAGGKHDAEALLQGFRSELGELPVVGGCGAGVMGAASAGTKLRAERP